MFTFFPSQERVCGGTTTPQEWFVVRHRPQERFCGVLSPTRTIFVRGNHAPQGLLTLGRLTLIFTNYSRNPSECLVLSVCCNVYQEYREEVYGSNQESDRVELKSSKLASLVHPYAELHSS